ncbi:hypothetical protein GQ44DRAFT_737684 [Phaeosphaeriaceae sp. PMI808]|nr:hypothetical protein GQ44DRAFT_737684 [Phaeosphaeriaceae sp. PMI808]
MSAQRIGIFTIAFPDPYAINYDNNKFTTINDSLSFQYRIFNNIQTLSTKGIDTSSDPYGILYVPDLHTDSCIEEERKHILPNVTRLANLPASKNYALIAVAPWYSPQCMIEYFTAARKAPTKALLVYQPGQSDTKPPVLNDPSWNLEDGGSWQRANTFPTYALTSITGANIMTQLARYSGNVTSIPHAEELDDILEPSDYVRLWATVATESGPRLPSLWVFLVIVLSILIVAVTGTSIAMHILQRKRRNDLRRRVIAGEVDLEALGVKRLNVSQHTLDKLPIYAYTSVPTEDSEKSQTQSPPPVLSVSSGSVHSETGVKSSQLVPMTSSSASWSQPTCPICLDDFEPNKTKVRELPCRHIFHPDCIDTFLLRNSSLCPMCKQSVLPVGACPVTITNIMVRRERHILRMRARSGQTANAQPNTTTSSLGAQPDQSNNPPPGGFGAVARRIGGAISGRRIFNTPASAPTRPLDIEMANNNASQHPVTGATAQNTSRNASPGPAAHSGTQECAPSQNRREWARQRALNLLGNRQAPATEAEEVESTPRWRRILNKVFPGFR